MHRLLERQLRRAGGSPEAPPEDWAAFLESISDAYRACDQDRELIERSMELVSEELTQANTSLRAERARLQSAFEHTPAAVAVYQGAEQVIAFANPVWEQLTGRRDAIGRPFREVFPELEATELPAVLRRVWETREPFFGNEVHVPLDRAGTGEPEDTWWNFVWQPLPGTGDILLHAVEVTAQVRARRQIEEKAHELEVLTRDLERSNRELDQFAYATSHDLKAPLRGIATLAEWIEEALHDSPETEAVRHLRLLRQRAYRLNALIEGILEYSRAGRQEAQIERVDTAALARDIVDLLQPSDDVTVRFGNLPLVFTERMPLQQVLQNLIANALKYAAADGGRIEIEAVETPSHWQFSVRDDGPGIPPEYHGRVFELFQRLERRDETEGAGIGLALVKKLVELRRGRVWVESVPGEGATFRFLWPKLAAPHHVAGQEPAA